MKTTTIELEYFELIPIRMEVHETPAPGTQPDQPDEDDTDATNDDDEGEDLGEFLFPPLEKEDDE